MSYPYVRFDQLESILGFIWSRAHVITLCKEGKFPKPYRLSANRVAWRVDELEAWKAALEHAEPQPGDKRGRHKRHKPRVAIDSD